jgi:hypothetical protein
VQGCLPCKEICGVTKRIADGWREILPQPCIVNHKEFTVTQPAYRYTFRV